MLDIVQVVNGYTIPVGHQVCVSPTTNHRLPDTWDEPEMFNPDRYAAASSSGVSASFTAILSDLCRN